MLLHPVVKVECSRVIVVLRGTVVNRTYGAHKHLSGIYFAIFTNNIWSYSIWSHVTVVSPIGEGWSSQARVSDTASPYPLYFVRKALLPLQEPVTYACFSFFRGCVGCFSFGG